MEFLHTIIQKISLVIASVTLVVTGTLHGQTPLPTPSPISTPNPVIATSTPSASPNQKPLITPKPTIIPRPTPKPEEVTCTRDEVISAMQKAGITFSEEQIKRNQSSCNLDKQKEWSTKNTKPLQGSDGN